MFPDFTNAHQIPRSASAQVRPSNVAAKAMAALAARQDELLDRALADTFPASDAVNASHID